MRIWAFCVRTFTAREIFSCFGGLLEGNILNSNCYIVGIISSVYLCACANLFLGGQILLYSGKLILVSYSMFICNDILNMIFFRFTPRLGSILLSP